HIYANYFFRPLTSHSKSGKYGCAFAATKPNHHAIAGAVRIRHFDVFDIPDV
ncbi:unnamed protein product, partial [marine sediment metagenome]